ncbi:hypothetical protein TIFTF001_044478 [Ficus carica]|uniref:Uncharacterized protein n=1 Tax=Ficus carica TaxID=3494 RepID=A0AA88D8V1_FICCA|nr:hypothetical protein TIFTF001_044478 [Ficus carica]
MAANPLSRHHGRHFIVSSTLPVFSSHFYLCSRAPISYPPCRSTNHLSPPCASSDLLLSCDCLCYRAIIMDSKGAVQDWGMLFPIPVPKIILIPT